MTIFNNLLFESLFLVFIYALINLMLKKNSFLLDKLETSSHKKNVYSKLNTPLSGGLFFIIFFSIYLIQGNFLFTIFLIAIYLIGLLSDLNLLQSPKRRIIIQACLIIFYVSLSNTKILSIGISPFDILLQDTYINLIFTTFCILIIINGYNFLDGINTLVIGNFIICVTSIILISELNNLNLNLNLILQILPIFVIIFIFNFLGKSFLGDSGSYSISFFISIILINFFYENYGVISPYYIASLIWYPALENLFTIIRRIFKKKVISEPDNNHFHQLLYSFLSVKIHFIKKLYLNSLTGILINIYMLVSAIIAFNFYTHTISLLILILINIIFYFLGYFYMYNKRH